MPSNRTSLPIRIANLLLEAHARYESLANALTSSSDEDACLAVHGARATVVAFGYELARAVVDARADTLPAPAKKCRHDFRDGDVCSKCDAGMRS